MKKIGLARWDENFKQIYVKVAEKRVKLKNGKGTCLKIYTRIIAYFLTYALSYDKERIAKIWECAIFYLAGKYSFRVFTKLYILEERTAYLKAWIVFSACEIWLDQHISLRWNRKTNSVQRNIQLMPCLDKICYRFLKLK